MKLLKEFFLLFFIWFLGEIISKFLLLPIPGSIIGMIILFLLLNFKIIKLKSIDTLSHYILTNLAFFFIPPGVELINSYGILKEDIFKLLFIVVSSTIIVAIITGLTVSMLIRKEEL